MAIVAKLQQGAYELDLTAAPYKIGEGFTPPSSTFEPTLAYGTSANRYGGATKLGQRANGIPWTLTVRITGTTNAQVGLGKARLAAFLERTGDKNNPLYFVYRPWVGIAAEPTWGQLGANRRFEIVQAQPPRPDPRYGEGTLRNREEFVSVSMLLKPMSIGKPQRLASATGGILESRMGVTDGRARGIVIPETTTNKMTNPVFGHSTWDNGWTADASLIVSQNTDPDFLLPGTLSSAKITAVTAGKFVQSINVGNTNTHNITCYARLPDGGAVSSSQLRFWYNVAIAGGSTSYTAVGDGWYRVRSQGLTGINAAVDTGVRVETGTTVYVTGVQMENITATHNFTPLCWGDMLGCAWTGTAHASTTTRTAARLRLTNDGVLSVDEGTIRLAMRMEHSHTRIDDSVYFHDTIGGMLLSYDTAVNQFNFTDGANSVNSATTTFQPGEVMMIHCVYGPSELSIYINGALSGTAGTTYTPREFGDYLYLGTTEVAGSPCNDTFMDVAIYGVAATAAEVLADYTNVAAHFAGGDGYGQTLAPIPYLWTKDGDDIVDNCNDSSRDNWCICGGIPGDAPADTLFALNIPSSLTTYSNLFISLLDMDTFEDPDALYSDRSGTVDANSSGGQYLSQSVSTGGYGPTFTITDNLKKALYGKAFYIFARVFDQGSNLQIKARDDDTDAATDWKSVTSPADWGLYYTPPLTLPAFAFAGHGYTKKSLEPSITFRRTTGTANIWLDYFQVMPRPLVAVNAATAILGEDVVMHGGQAYEISSGTDLDRAYVVTGDTIELLPNKLNMLMSLMGGDKGTDPEIAATIFYAVTVTPRYAVL